MKHYLFLVLFLSLVTACTTEVHNKVGKAKILANISYAPMGALELGTLDHHEYKNNYFRFSLNIPMDKWAILNEKQYAGRLAANKEELNVPDKTWKRTTDNLHNLLTIERILNNDERHSSQSISFTAEGLDNIPNVNSVIEYFEYTERYCNKHYSESYPKFTFTGMDTALVGNRLFLVESMTIADAPFINRFQKTYSAQFDNYLLNILVNYNSDEEQKENESVLKRIKWN